MYPKISKMTGTPCLELKLGNNLTAVVKGFELKPN